MAKLGSTKAVHERRARDAARELRTNLKGMKAALRHENCASALNYLGRAERFAGRLGAEKSGTESRRGAGGGARAVRAAEVKFKKACIR